MVLARPGAERDLTAGRAAVGVEADRARGGVDQLRLGGVQPQADAVRQRPRLALAADAEVVGVEVEHEDDLFVAGDGAALRALQPPGHVPGGRLQPDPAAARDRRREHEQEEAEQRQHDQELDQREPAFAAAAVPDHQLVTSWFSPSPPSALSAPRE
jgi:hypothetical protein